MASIQITHFVLQIGHPFPLPDLIAYIEYTLNRVTMKLGAFMLLRMRLFSFVLVAFACYSLTI